MILFPVAVVIIYGILFLILPDKASMALRNSGSVFLNMLIPLCSVFAIMVILNIFLKPAQIARFLGKSAGIKGRLLSAMAGIISTGPIYVWYPLLSDFRSKGAGNSPIAIFLYNRAVKPFLLPVMIGYFGWVYVVVLTVCLVLGSFVLGYAFDLIKSDGQ